jgi:hypothetical protein
MKKSISLFRCLLVHDGCATKSLSFGGANVSSIRGIKTDAASPDLAEAVNKILIDFPPKK